MPIRGEPLASSQINNLEEEIRRNRIIDTSDIRVQRGPGGTALYVNRQSPGAVRFAPSWQISRVTDDGDGTVTLHIGPGWCRYGDEAWTELGNTTTAIGVGEQIWVEASHATGEFSLHKSGTAPDPDGDRAVWVIAVVESEVIRLRWQADCIVELDRRGDEYMVFQRKKDVDGKRIYGVDWTRAHD